MRIRCKLGIHKWEYTSAKYKSLQDEELAIAIKEATRTCTECGKHQTQDLHCLGLNPPQYITHWRTP